MYLTAAEFSISSRSPWPGWTSSVDAPASSMGASGEPACAPTLTPFVRTVCPSFVRPLVARVWMFGMSSAANAPRGLPSSSMGADSQRATGVGPACAGSGPPPTHGSDGSYVAASLLPGALQTVVSLRTSGFVSAADGSVPSAWRAASFGSVTMIIP